MTTVTYDVVIHGTVEIDTRDLIEESVHEIIESACGNMPLIDHSNLYIEIELA